MAKVKEVEPEPIAAPVPKDVPVPPDAATHVTIVEAEAMVTEALEKAKAAPPGPKKDQALELIQELKADVESLKEKVKAEGGPVERADQTRRERAVTDGVNTGTGRKLLQWLDDTLGGRRTTDADGSDGEREADTDPPEGPTA